MERLERWLSIPQAYWLPLLRREVFSINIRDEWVIHLLWDVASMLTRTRRSPVRARVKILRACSLLNAWLILWLVGVARVMDERHGEPCVRQRRAGTRRVYTTI